MKLVDEFKAFAMKGNVVDMAVGIIIGAAFVQNHIISCKRHHHATSWTYHRRRKFYRS